MVAPMRISFTLRCCRHVSLPIGQLISILIGRSAAGLDPRVAFIVLLPATTGARKIKHFSAVFPPSKRPARARSERLGDARVARNTSAGRFQPTTGINRLARFARAVDFPYRSFKSQAYTQLIVVSIEPTKDHREGRPSSPRAGRRQMSAPASLKDFQNLEGGVWSGWPNLTRRPHAPQLKYFSLSTSTRSLRAFRGRQIDNCGFGAQNEVSQDQRALGRQPSSECVNHSARPQRSDRSLSPSR